MRRFLAALFTSCCLSVVTAPAAAAQAEGRADPRLPAIDVSQASVIPLRLRPGYALQILLPSGEQVAHVVMGEARGWEVATFDDSLVLKPLVSAEATNLLITAKDKEGAQRYRFELTLAGARDSAPYELRLLRPSGTAEIARASAMEAEVRERTVVEETLTAAPFEGPRNLAYSAQGALELQPSEVSDNGRFTVLRFPAQQPIPSIYEVSREGVERLVTFHIQGEFLVVHLVAQQLRLRRGSRHLCLFNEAFNPYGGSERTGTASGRLVRDLKLETQRP